MCDGTLGSGGWHLIRIVPHRSSPPLPPFSHVAGDNFYSRGLNSVNDGAWRRGRSDGRRQEGLAGGSGACSRYDRCCPAHQHAASPPSLLIPATVMFSNYFTNICEPAPCAWPVHGAPAVGGAAARWAPLPKATHCSLSPPLTPQPPRRQPASAGGHPVAQREGMSSRARQQVSVRRPLRVRQPQPIVTCALPPSPLFPGAWQPRLRQWRLLPRLRLQPQPSGGLGWPLA